MANVYLNKNKETRVLGGHPWVFRSDIAEVQGDHTPGGVVRVLSARHKFLGMAVYNPQSQISLRMLSRRDESINSAWIKNRVKRAIDYRRHFADLKSCRLLFAESDGLPAVIADAFGDVIVLQVLCLGMERFKQDIVDALVEELHPMHFWVDVKEGQKTGFFLDQKENRAAIAPFVKDARVLDCFTHTGSFALHAGHFGAKEVIGVDISDFACECATENARLNHLENVVRFECANAFDYLRSAQDAHEQFDVVILDPPAFTKTRSAVEGALRGYKEINLRGMKLVRDGGFLVTCSCSQHVTPDLFQKMILDAQKDARVQLRQIEWRTQGKDHPILPSSPETQYLKCGIYQVFKG